MKIMTDITGNFHSLYPLLLQAIDEWAIYEKNSGNFPPLYVDECAIKVIKMAIASSISTSCRLHVQYMKEKTQKIPSRNFPPLFI